MRVKKLKIMGLLTVFILNGCAEMNSTFDCPMKPGVRCESLDRINAKVDSGELVRDTHSSLSHAENVSGMPIRKKEKVMPIWIAPYEDKAGNYHDGHSIYSAVKTAQWERG